MCVCVCVCVCVQMQVRDRERQRQRKKERQRESTVANARQQVSTHTCFGSLIQLTQPSAPLPQGMWCFITKQWPAGDTLPKYS